MGGFVLRPTEDSLLDFRRLLNKVHTCFGKREQVEALFQIVQKMLQEASDDVGSSSETFFGQSCFTAWILYYEWCLFSLENTLRGSAPEEMKSFVQHVSGPVVMNILSPFSAVFSESL
jgi:hypothetical protein